MTQSHDVPPQVQALNPSAQKLSVPKVHVSYLKAEQNQPPPFLSRRNPGGYGALQR